MVSNDELKAMILHKLAKKRKWGESHTAFENVAKGVPPHIKRKLKELTNKLINEGFIIPKPTGYGLHISLNVAKSEEIKSIIKKYFEMG